LNAATKSSKLRKTLTGAALASYVKVVKYRVDVTKKAPKKGKGKRKRPTVGTYNTKAEADAKCAEIRAMLPAENHNLKYKLETAPEKSARKALGTTASALGIQPPTKVEFMVAGSSRRDTGVKYAPEMTTSSGSRLRPLLNTRQTRSINMAKATIKEKWRRIHGFFKAPELRQFASGAVKKKATKEKALYERKRFYWVNTVLPRLKANLVHYKEQLQLLEYVQRHGKSQNRAYQGLVLAQYLTVRKSAAQYIKADKKLPDDLAALLPVNVLDLLSTNLEAKIVILTVFTKYLIKQTEALVDRLHLIKQTKDVIEYRYTYLDECTRLALRKPVWVQQRADLVKDLPHLQIAHRYSKEGVDMVEFHVDNLGTGGLNANWKDETYTELRRKLGKYGGCKSVRFPTIVNCKYGHSKSACKCGRLAYHMGQDESIYKAYALSSRDWVTPGRVVTLRKKCDGQGCMVSGVVDEIRGYGFPMTEAELAEVNDYRKTQGRGVLLFSPGHILFNYGKNKQGYWGFEQIYAQIRDLMVRIISCII